MEVSVVIVCMNRPDLLYPCLESIRSHTTVSYELWVVAYRFTPENLAALRKDYPEAHVVVSDGLRGFSEHNNLALRQVQGRYCFVVNDDTYFSTPVIDRLVADFDRLPAAEDLLPGRAGPDLRPRTLDGRALDGPLSPPGR